VIQHLDRKRSLAFLQERAETMNRLVQEMGLKF